MFASVRKYKVIPSQLSEFNRQVNDGFVPIVSKAPGFVSYHGVDAGNGDWASISIFESQAGADESNRQAASFVAEHLAALIEGQPEIVAGHLAVSKRK
jgi:hypothetical protein